MAKGDWWFKFEIPAWRNSPELRQCSLATRGFWIDCIAIMRDSGKATIKGTATDFARMVGCFPKEAAKCIDELRRTKTADVIIGNANVTPVTFLYGNVTLNVTLVSRKMKRELSAKEKTKLRVQKHRSNADVTVDVTPVKRDKVKSKEKEVIRKEEEREERRARANGKPFKSKSQDEVVRQTESAVSFPLNTALQMVITKTVPRRLVKDWIQLIELRLLGDFPKTEKEITKRFRYWIQDFIKDNKQEIERLKDDLPTVEESEGNRTIGEIAPIPQ